MVGGIRDLRAVLAAVWLVSGRLRLATRFQIVARASGAKFRGTKRSAANLTTDCQDQSEAQASCCDSRRDHEFGL